MIGLALSKHSEYFQTLELIAICTIFYECYCESEKVKVQVTQWCPTLCNRMDCSPWDSSGQNTGMGGCSLLQGIFPTQGSNPGLPHCRWILYQLSHQGSPRIPEWVDYPFSSGSSWPRNQTGVSCIAGRFFTSWATKEAHVTVPGWFYCKSYLAPT